VQRISDKGFSVGIYISDLSQILMLTARDLNLLRGQRKLCEEPKGHDRIKRVNLSALCPCFRHKFRFWILSHGEKIYGDSELEEIAGLHFSPNGNVLGQF
jgi:hypothetical protein